MLYISYILTILIFFVESSNNSECLYENIIGDSTLFGNSSETITLENCFFANIKLNGDNSNGSIINTEGDVEVDNCTFINTSSGENGGLFIFSYLEHL
jgi:hypothetical protein